MDNLIRVYDDVIDEESCQKLIEKFEKFEEHFEEVYEKDEEERISFKQLQLVKFKEWESVQQGMLELFQDYIVRYKMDCNIKDKQWPEEYGYEAIRMKRYLNNDIDRFDPHVDVLDHNTARRFLAFFIYVNDVDEGGETKFVNLNKEGTYIPLTVNPKRGRLLMFPPMWPWYHAGLKPESGKKYLIHSYCHYA
tara:strand:- start:217 stop:795 length:579 start_codon:yes stop_codon:yes gene_type:complete